MSDEMIWAMLEKPKVEDRLEKAKAVREKMGIYGKGGQATEAFYKISDVHTQGIFEWCFGMIWSQPLLDLKTKEIVVISTMAAQDLPDELEWHVRSALNLGLTEGEIIEVIVQCTPYIGLPKTNHALHAAQRAFEKAAEEKSE
ncbi:MAG: carboxymuconolactone decarboxylase family protein [Nitrospinaceae bacterium]|jgi:4-carboxymuconolactone decarboxylase|nr:carboxymuconolactone decarboxylase family protein [Nitrospinaceae bacterium]MBT3435831.1 carboxymuconolactone decarboxylase family protein [Nitrospinaceae bacterium]MBT3822413.1 carboxymuconolactone decarboxylase family protein [Nitrospinaceae bacterium]MBT4094116.1 carboxymuconolactone decarboxylase family protein [Nitrospinaceae bacterium]MBT4431635.1 carboxymuconolactone decarboxylase family protein [Nitrospinaceae bacterium]